VDERWDVLVGQFRQLCLLRRQKKFIESDIILTSELPRAIAEWSELSDAEPAAKKSRLDAMFQAEQRRIDDNCFTMDLLTNRLKEEILPSICAEITEQVRAAVIENVRATILQEIRASMSDDIRKFVADEFSKMSPALQSSKNLAEPAEARPAPVAKDHLLSNFAEQVRSTVAQKAYVAVLEELAREKKPTPVKALESAQRIQTAQKVPPPVAPRPKAPAASAPARVPRPAVTDVSAVIDFVLAEEQQILKNKYKFELSACP
jgi:hypothetical protein